jgi:hypothetical protein
METEANFLFCGEKEKSTAPDVTIRASREEEESVAMRKEEHAAPQRKRQVCFCGPAAVATEKEYSQIAFRRRTAGFMNGDWCCVNLLKLKTSKSRNENLA